MARAVAAASESVPSELPEKPRAVEKPPPDPLQPIECSALLLKHPYGVNQTDPSIRVGYGVSNGINVGGLCERIVLHPNGTYIVHVRKSVAKHMPDAERARFPMQYLVFREGFGEVAT
jgi:hypothetical protein